MANNRMYLRCKGCGKEFFLGKRFGGGYYISQYEQYKGVPLMERLNKFYEDHEWCGDEGLDCFELIYEDPPELLTNADRIRAMSDEELAEWLANNQDCYACAYFDDVEGICKGGESCREMMLDWLKQEASNGD